MSKGSLKYIAAITATVTLTVAYSVVCNSETSRKASADTAALNDISEASVDKNTAKSLSIKALEMEKMGVKAMPAKAMPPKIMPESTFNPAPDMSPVENPNGYLARIMLDSPEEVEKALLRAEELYKNGKVSDADNPLAFVLHGPEVEIFFKDNYEQYKSIVDLAARLSAFKVVDVKVCSNRLNRFGETKEALPAFVETVPFGPQEVERLIVKEKYVYF